MANLPPELIAVLRCPVTGSELVQEGDQLVSTGTDAAGRQLRYRIDEGIPVLLPAAPEAAGPEAASPTAPDKA
ncbi:Trm112 family protein [Arthrobacter sp. GCM10027362]|uniref:Trm112 family protein n=1 Tax=Arthrobacter sp. GCM10027362 TaxID=3273379 RepID=UPI003634FEE5